MTEKNNPPFDPEDELRAENEAKKIKLQLEHGMLNMDSSGDLDPHIESQFLDQVFQFEEAYKNAKQTTVYKLIGSPDYKAVDKLSDEEIPGALQNILEIMKSNNVSLDNICPVDDRELYRFITEELFLHEMDDMRVSGMMSCFIYEEFHPNAELDLRNDSENFIHFFFSKEPEFYTHHLAREIRGDNWFMHFSNTFDSFTLHTLEINVVQHDDKNATVLFYIDFSGNTEGSGYSKCFSGEGKLKFQRDEEYWYIHEVVLPV